MQMTFEVTLLYVNNLNSMSKTTFIDRFERTQKFFDNVYHHHKATYKGLGQFFSNYADVQKNYANSLLWQAQTTSSCIPDLNKQQPSVQQAIREIANNLEKVSQLHHNFGERLREIGEYCKQQYNESKRNKEKFMKLKVQKNKEDHDRLKSNKDRQKINQKQQQICRLLYNSLEEYMEDEINRTQKLKEQIIIYFSLSKKYQHIRCRVAEREVELTSTHSLKMAQFEINVTVSQLQQIQDGLVEQHNGYGGDKLAKKDRKFNKQMAVHRESLRQSIIHREKAVRLNESLSKMAKIVQKYKNVPEELNYPKEEDYLIGIFDKRVIPHYKQYTNLFRSEALKQIAFAWLSSYFVGNEAEDDVQSLLTVAKANLKTRHIQLSKTKSIQDFITKFTAKSDNSHKPTLWFLIQLSQVYEGTLRISQLDESLRNSLFTISETLEHPFHWKIGLVIVDSLLDSVIVIADEQHILYDQYNDILKLIITFAKGTFNLPSTIVITLLLRKLKRAFAVAASYNPERIEELFSANFDLNDEFSQTQELKMHICHQLINFLTLKMSTFYKSNISFSNLVKMSMAVQMILPKNYFTAIEHMHSCIKVAGFKFFEEVDEQSKVMKAFWKGEDRLKCLTQVLQQLQLEKINTLYLEPIAHELSHLLGVGSQVVLSKMKKQFSTPISEIVQCNLQILNEEQRVDQQGYVLRLGICLALLDQQQPQPVAAYSLFFTVLENYLTSTEKDYDQLLEHARKTQLWIVEENSQATQNCIDFCSLLYKPFEYLLISLKKLQEEELQTEYTIKYSDFIKLRLNTALKNQIQKYVKFLEDSLNVYTHQQPQLLFKYKRLANPYTVQNEQIAKERFTFKEVTRRYFNLIFLKEQLDQLVKDFIDKDLYRSINNSIFNLEKLHAAASTHPTHRALLTNIHTIALLISTTEERLMAKIGSISVYYFMKRVLANLYYQQEKGFFASDKDYKLSEFTFVKHQSELEQLFLNITRNIPPDIIDTFSKQFCLSFYRAYRVELLDTNKFKIPIKQDLILSYLRSDLNFFCNLAKQKFMAAEILKEHLEEPCYGLLKDLEKSNQKLMDGFSEANVKNNNNEAKYYLCLLNVRKDEKAEEFVQKYKKLLK